MNKLFLSIILLCSLSKLYSQEICFKYTTLFVTLNFYHMEFSITKLPNEIDSNSKLYHDPYLKGKLKIKNKIITCIDNSEKKTYIFYKLDNYTLEVLKNSTEFKKGDKLYSTSRYNKKGDLVCRMSWKNGKRDGFWTYINYKHGVKRVRYRKGVAIDSTFQTYEEMEKLLPPRINSVAYGNKR